MSFHLSRGAALTAAALVLLGATTLPLAADAQPKAASVRWATYFGGTDADLISAMAQLSGGETVVVGNTRSASLEPNATPGSLSSQNFFLARFDSDGRGVFKQVYGGGGTDTATAVAVSSQGEAYIVGSTLSTTVTGCTSTYRTPHRGMEDGFIAKVKYDGTCEWFMYLGGDRNDVVTGVALVGTALYVVGHTDSTNFLGGPSAATGDGFVIKLNTANPDVFSWGPKLIGGSGKDQLFGLTEEAGKLLVVGTTSSNPISTTPPPLRPYRGGASDAFVARFDTDLGGLEWVTYVGGANLDEGKAIKVMPLSPRRIVIAGHTNSTGLSPPPVPGGRNALVTWLTLDGALLENRVVGGGADDEAVDIAFDTSSTTYIVGTTASDNLLANNSVSVDTSIESGTGLREGFVAALPAAGGEGWISYFGGNGADISTGMVFVPQSQLLVAMQTSSDGGFPMARDPAYDSTPSTPTDGYLAALDLADITPPVAGVVSDGLDPSMELQEQTSTTTLSANWTPFSDGAQVIQYEWALGTFEAPELLLPFTSVGTASARTQPGLTLNVGTRYYATVRARNIYGITTVERSNGVMITLPDGGTGEPDGGSQEGDGGTEADGGTGDGDGGTEADGGTGDGGGGTGDAGPDGDGEPDPTEPGSPLGWGCASGGGAGVPLLLGLMLLGLLGRRLATRDR
ncbi:hypothetical protein [Hyalangium gracile]|uniref:hypothetical protein n=1 Tax=Hyalangium gracile TaxID=394092 RepID=UPI001CCE2930|nr:hypothetical protein [Hyalangium gracile]